MNKTELLVEVSSRAQVTKKVAGDVYDAMVAAIIDELSKGGSVQLLGFGSFEISERAARTGRNPQTGQTITIAARKSPRFKPGKQLKDACNK